MSQSFSQSQKPACVQCGGTEYVLESGYYFCIECQVQSQDIRDQVYEEFLVGGKFKSLRTAVSSSKPQEQTEVKSNDITSWEALNIILHGLIEELKLLGAPKELNVVVLQLWVCHLKKLEAAFTSKRIEKRPRLGLTFRQRDAEIVYKTNEKVASIQRRPVFQRKRQASSSRSRSHSESSFRTKLSGMRQLLIKKKKLASSEYSNYLDASSGSQGSFQSELTLNDLSTVQPEKSEKSYRFHYSKSAKRKLLNLLENAAMVEGENRAYLQNRCLKRDSRSLEHLSIAKLVAIIRLALLLLKSDIHLGDLLRWSDEGYLSLLNAEKLIPLNIMLCKDIKLIFVTALNSRNCINRTVTKMANLLGIKGLRSNLLPLVKRYLKELCLPDEMYSLIQNLIGLKPPKFVLNSTVNYEARALAYIIFMLKYLFSLDGVTERNISTVASLVNNDTNSSQKLFNLEAWMKYINCRSSVLSFHHQSTRNLHYPTSRYGGADAFLSQWEKIPAKQTVPRLQIIDRDLSETLRRFTKEFCLQLSEPLPPSLYPRSAMLEAILATKSLPDRTRRILEHDFTGDTLGYLFDLRMQNEICEKYGVSLTSIPSAEFIIVRPLKGVVNISFGNPNLNRRKVVPVIVTDNSNDLKRNIIIKEAQHGTLIDKRDILSQTENLLQGGKLKFVSNEQDKLSWSGAGRGCWTYHTSASNKYVQSATFEHLAETVFQPDFLWLLREASHIGHVSPKELYRELVKVEKVCLQVLKPGRKKPCVRDW